MVLLDVQVEVSWQMRKVTLDFRGDVETRWNSSALPFQLQLQTRISRSLKCCPFPRARETRILSEIQALAPSFPRL